MPDWRFLAMNMNRISVSIALLLALGAGGTRAHGLGIGDPAPPLTIAEWVRGDPIDLKANKGKKVHLIEFWAVWCPPCKVTIPRLTELQDKYKKDLVIIGVTSPDYRGNNPPAIRRFVKEQGDTMRYTVAIDKSDATTNAYMLAARAVGIPHAFLVDKEGTIVWQGSPLEPELPGVIGQVIAGKYDFRAAKLEAEVQGRLQGVFLALQVGQTGAAWDELIGILKLDPGNEIGLDILTRVYVDQVRDKKLFRSWADAHVTAHRNDAVAMTRLAEALFRISDLTMRMPDLALDVAGSAYDARSKSDWVAIAVYARAHFQIGDLDRAISVQEDAVAAADTAGRQASQEILDHYNLCKRLRERTN